MDETIALPLSESERRILELHDRLQELSLELALMRATGDRLSQQAEPAETVTEKAINNAQDRLLEARASYSLRNSVLENVMFVNPILKAVHNGTQASPIERDMLPYIEQRDDASTEVLRQFSRKQEIMEKVTRAEVEAMRISRENVKLASEVTDLAERANQGSDMMVGNRQANEQLQRLEKDVKASRHRWKIMKGTAGAVVAGSGVDWVNDELLREMVLDTD